MHRALAWLLSWFVVSEAAEEASGLSTRSKRKRSRCCWSMLYAVPGRFHPLVSSSVLYKYFKTEDCLDAGS